MTDCLEKVNPEKIIKFMNDFEQKEVENQRIVIFFVVIVEVYILRNMFEFSIIETINWIIYSILIYISYRHNRYFSIIIFPTIEDIQNIFTTNPIISINQMLNYIIYIIKNLYKKYISIS